MLLVLSLPAQAEPMETWRFTHSMPLGGSGPDPADLVGKSLRFTAGEVSGPAPLSCAPARIERLEVPAEGLFEGGLEAPADLNARALGLGRFPAALRRAVCPNSSFDYVNADDETLLVVLDGRVWSLSNTAGTRADSDAPEATVQALLEAHFAGDRGFAPAALDSKQRWLSVRLRAAIKTYFARARPQGEVPPIDGDAFTDTQEGPTRFAVGSAETTGDSARLPVRFADGWSEKRLRYLLVREPDGWRLDDIAFDETSPRTLRMILDSD
ncbi:MAG: hypothetical protein ACT4QA_13480 [Panacagrimonas sp.]